jgi:hypothetical protein
VSTAVNISLGLLFVALTLGAALLQAYVWKPRIRQERR